MDDEEASENGAPEEAKFTESEVRKKIQELKMALKTQSTSVRKPPMFDDEQTDIRTFVEDFDGYRQVIDLDKKHAYGTLLTYLPEMHRTRLRHLNKTKRELSDWDNTKNVVTKALTPPTQKLEARLKLNSARQKKEETVLDFLERLRKLVDQSYDKPEEEKIRERILKDHFINGVREDTVAVDLLANSEAKPLDMLVQMAMKT